MSRVITNGVVLGRSPTAANNFLLDTDTAGALRIRRGADGSGGLVMSINSAGIPLDKDGFDMRPLGVGQTWQDVTGIRAQNTTYSNTTGRPILVNISATVINTASWRLVVGGVVVGTQNGTGASSNAPHFISAVVPPGASYSMNYTVGSGTVAAWSELRT